MIFDLPLAQVDAARLEALRADGVREGRQLDYKETLPGNSDEDKKEFLADVTSFANAAGGDLIFGVSERRDANGKATGEIDAVVGLGGLNVDPERLRLESIIRDGVAPRLPPVTVHEIRRDGAPPCLLLRIPRSWAGLHMVTFRNLSRFYARTSGGKYQLDVQEIRAGFLAGETAYENLRRFRAERVARILALETPAAMADGPKLIFHALPVSVDGEVWQRLLNLEDQAIVQALALIGGSTRDFRFNLDGYVVHTLRDDPSRQCYTQLFRSGGVEAVSGGVVAKDEGRGGFYPQYMEEKVIGALNAYKKFWGTLAVTPPVSVSLTLSGVKGWRALIGPAYGESEAVFDRDMVSPPEVVLSDFATPSDVLLRPVFDFVWNGAGYGRAPGYREGRWVRLR
jgi:hypothetical protein